MDRRDFVLHRVAFAGLPYGALREAEAAHGAPHAWRKGMLQQARQLRARARQAQDSGAAASAAQYFRWAGVAYHGATLGPDLAELDALPRVSRLRGLAVAAYRRALKQDPSCRSLLLEDGTGRVAGYCRWPERVPRGVVVLLNGLDSLCEVELHAFGTGLLERDVVALSLDLPARFSSTGRRDMQIERLLPSLRRWLAAHDLGRLPLGVFGVSFGGYLAARMLAGDTPFAAGVAISPPAWIDAQHRAHPYFSRMFSWSFRTDGPEELARLAATVSLDHLAAPGAPMRLYAMTEDRLFGPAHTQAYARWGGPRIEVRTVPAEHVGTSSFHLWLPDVFDWFAERFAHA